MLAFLCPDTPSSFPILRSLTGLSTSASPACCNGVQKLPHFLPGLCYPPPLSLQSFACSLACLPALASVTDWLLLPQTNTQWDIPSQSHPVLPLGPVDNVYNGPGFSRASGEEEQVAPT
jgi:hypothetical protein